jgi:hypothetical protein
MKKALMTFMFIFIFIIEHLSISADASELPGTGVYATLEEQNQIIRSFGKQEIEHEGLWFSLVIESIEPQYLIDCKDLAKSGKIELKERRTEQHARFYYAKMLLDDGRFGGTAVFSERNGKIELITSLTRLSADSGLISPARQKLDDPTSKNFTSLQSPSYADHAEAIRLLLGKEEIIPQEQVRYVTIMGSRWTIGTYFYIQDEDKEYFVSCPADDVRNGLISRGRKYGYFTGDELKDVSKEYLGEYEEYLAKKEEWEARNPGKRYIGGTGEIALPFKSRSDLPESKNIVNIREYLAANTKTPVTPVYPKSEEPETPAPSGDPASPEKSDETPQALPSVTAKATPWQAWIGVGAAAALALAAGIVLARRKNEE